MSEEKKNEVLYLPTDDTDKIIKEPIPAISNELKEKIKKHVKEAKSTIRK